MRIRQHVNPLAPYFQAFRGEVPPMAAGAEVELEIGCADAQFLFERAALDPTAIYVGCEIREDLVALVNRRARREGLPVHAVFCQAQKHLDAIFEPGRVARVFVNFPDPWFKKKHHERRMIDEELAAGIARAACPGASVFVQSDVWEVALDAMSVFERDGRYVNVAGDWSFWRSGNPYGVRSWREQNAEEMGLTVWRIMYRLEA